MRRDQHICRLPVEKPKQPMERVRAQSDYKNITADNFFSPLNVAAQNKFFAEVKSLPKRKASKASKTSSKVKAEPSKTLSNFAVNYMRIMDPGLYALQKKNLGSA